MSFRCSFGIFPAICSPSREKSAGKLVIHGVKWRTRFCYFPSPVTDASKTVDTCQLHQAIACVGYTERERFIGQTLPICVSKSSFFNQDRYKPIASDNRPGFLIWLPIDGDYGNLIEKYFVLPLVPGVQEQMRLPHRGFSRFRGFGF